MSEADDILINIFAVIGVCATIAMCVMFWQVSLAVLVAGSMVLIYVTREG